MTKEISEGLKKQKQLIKEVINPFFKSNGFARKGVKYVKKLDYFIIEVEIQRQRYYKDERVENFRINMGVYSENSYRLVMKFGGYSIAGENSWITTDESTNLSELASWLSTELNNLLPKIEEYNHVEKIIEKVKNWDSHNREYGFLLKDTNRIKEFQQWVDEKNKEIKKLNSEILNLSQQIDCFKKGKNELLNEIEYWKLCDERKSKEIRIEFIMRFLKEINET